MVGCERFTPASISPAHKPEFLPTGVAECSFSVRRIRRRVGSAIACSIRSRVGSKLVMGQRVRRQNGHVSEIDRCQYTAPRHENSSAALPRGSQPLNAAELKISHIAFRQRTIGLVKLTGQRATANPVAGGILLKNRRT